VLVQPGILLYFNLFSALVRAQQCPAGAT
jgi:hypothetical protein